MFLQKQKNILKSVIKRLGKKPLPWHVLRPGLLILVSIGVAGLAVYAQPAPSHSRTNTHRTDHSKSLTHHVSAPPKVTPPTPPPAAAPPPPAAPPPAPVKTAPQAGTPKPEPVVTPSPGSSVSGLTPTTPPPTSPSPQTPSSQTTTGYLSTNWSGYLAANGTFTGVSASWTATLATGNGSTTSADSTWIGIGGVTSNDLIQVGTQNIISASGQVSTSAFYELLPNSSQTVPGVTVSEGDSMTASLTEISSGQWTVTITDKTDGESWTTSIAYVSSLSSAEWIEEDPSFISGRLIPFDNFHEAAFAGGLTIENGSSINIAASTSQPVTMVNSSGQPVAIPSAIGSDGASFTVTP